MRDKNERRIRHVTQLKSARVLNRKTASRKNSGDRIISDRVKGKTYKEILVDGQKFYVTLNANKES